jgi:hypothetical protein
MNASWTAAEASPPLLPPQPSTAMASGMQDSERTRVFVIGDDFFLAVPVWA